jgi:hypothetical protein
MVRDSHQREFCNTIGSKADEVDGSRSRHLGAKV